MALHERTWRLLDTGHLSGPENMAIDEAIMRAHGRGDTPPTLRFYGWKPAAVSIGYFQSMAQEIDLEAVRQGGFGYVRRATGGRMIFHHQELTYSVTIREGLLPGDVISTYRELSHGLLRGLQLLGLSPELSGGGLDPRRTNPDDVNTLCFEQASAYELEVGGRKIAGSAQTRQAGVRLQHGSIVLDYDLPLYLSLLKVSSATRSRLLERFRSKATCMRSELDRAVTFAEARDAFITGFAQGLGITLLPGQLTAVEQTETAHLIETKYGSDTWNLKK
jgi:lipoate-protein ligase A